MKDKIQGVFLRVIAGTAKGRKLLSPKGDKLTRPTTDKVKEAIFGKLQFRLPSSRVLDLFAGSGALGIEALSRGAEHAIFVDCADEAIANIKQNLTATNLLEQATIFKMPAMEALRRLSASETQFDFIFLDPPYAAGLYEEVIDEILSKKLLKADGLLVIEHDERVDLSKYRLDGQKRYGTVFISYLSAGENA